MVQTKGWQRSFQPSMKRPIAAISSFTLPKLPWRMAYRVMIEKKIPTIFSQDPEVGVKWTRYQVAGASGLRPTRSPLGRWRR